MLKWIGLVILIGLSAFFSAAETALTTFNKIRMREKADEGSSAAGLLLKPGEVRIFDQEFPLDLQRLLPGERRDGMAHGGLLS